MDQITYLENLKNKIQSFPGINFYEGKSEHFFLFKNCLAELEAFIDVIFKSESDKLLKELREIDFYPFVFMDSPSELQCFEAFNQGRNNCLIFINKLIGKIRFKQQFEKEQKTNNDVEKANISKSYTSPVNVTGNNNNIYVTNGDNSNPVFKDINDKLDKADLDNELKMQLKEIVNEIQKSKESNDKSSMKKYLEKFMSLAGKSLPSILDIVGSIIGLI